MRVLLIHLNVSPLLLSSCHHQMQNALLQELKKPWRMKLGRIGSCLDVCSLISNKITFRRFQGHLKSLMTDINYFGMLNMKKSLGTTKIFFCLHIICYLLVIINSEATKKFPDSNKLLASQGGGM